MQIILNKRPCILCFGEEDVGFGDFNLKNSSNQASSNIY